MARRYSNILKFSSSSDVGKKSELVYFYSEIPPLPWHEMNTFLRLFYTE